MPNIKIGDKFKLYFDDFKDIWFVTLIDIEDNKIFLHRNNNKYWVDRAEFFYNAFIKNIENKYAILVG